MARLPLCDSRIDQSTACPTFDPRYCGALTMDSMGHRLQSLAVFCINPSTNAPARNDMDLKIAKAKKRCTGMISPHICESSFNKLSAIQVFGVGRRRRQHLLATDAVPEESQRHFPRGGFELSSGRARPSSEPMRLLF